MDEKRILQRVLSKCLRKLHTTILAFWQQNVASNSFSTSKMNELLRGMEVFTLQSAFT